MLQLWMDLPCVSPRSKTQGKSIQSWNLFKCILKTQSKSIQMGIKTHSKPNKFEAISLFLKCLTN